MRYWSGFASGVCALTLWLFGVLSVYFIPNQVEMYKEVKGATLPTLTLFVLSPAWHWTIPTVGLAAVLALNFAKIQSETRRSVALATTAALLLFTLVFTYWATSLPAFELAGHISTK